MARLTNSPPLSTVIAIGAPLATIGVSVAATLTPVNDRSARRMSTAQRRAVNERMKKYWAARRKAKKA